MAALKFADRILFTGSKGILAEPPWVEAKVDYLGPILRNFQYSRSDRERVRRELGIASESFAIAVFPGSWNEALAPSLDLVLARRIRQTAGGKA